MLNCLKRKGLIILALLLCAASAPAQTVLFEETFDAIAREGRPAGWEYTPGWFHTLQPQPTGDSVHQWGIPESTAWAQTGNPEVDWQVTEVKRFSIYDSDRGTDGLRDYWCKYALDAEGEPIPEAPVSAIMPGTDKFVWTAPEANAPVSRTRAGGSTAPWVNEYPYPNFGSDPVTGKIDENAKVLVSDSDEYGGVNYNAAIITPAVDLKGSKYARVSYKYQVEQNQDSECAAYVQLDNGPWQTLQRFSMHYHGDDYNYLGEPSFVVKTDGAKTLRCLWYQQGNFSWYLCMDDFKVTGYDAEPADGPAKPQAVSPVGPIASGEDVVLKASAYTGAAAHAFTQWQIRDNAGTYGQLVDYTDHSFSELYPVVDTGIQPNHYSNGAYVWREGGVWSGALLRDRPNPAAQLSVPTGDGFGEKTEQLIPANMLRPGIKYYWRVRYWDVNLLSSPWSDEQTFTVRAIPGKSLFAENFDGIQDPDVKDPADTIPAGWNGLFGFQGWDVASLGVYQLFYNNPEQAYKIANKAVEPGLSAANSTEPDGRGHHGRFRGNVMVSESGSFNDLTTPEINNSASTQPLYLLFDVSVRTGNDNVAFAVDLKDAAGATSTIYEFSNVSADYADSVMKGRTNSVVYCLSPAIKVDAAAGKRVRFVFYSSAQDGGDEWVALDNVEVVQYDPAAPVGDWELF
ncbi:MAG: hypothetical protein AB1656_12305 [Candidatus Omnitrophota bacterium]